MAVPPAHQGPSGPERPNAGTADMSFEFEALRHANNYRQALLQEFGPYLQGRVVEVGAGIGQVSEMIARCAGVQEVVAVEPEAGFCRELERRLAGHRVVCGTIQALAPGLEARAIVCVNVLEHIRDDQGELRHYHSLLKKQGGHLCLFVPARQEIYAPMDKDFGHFRRYHKPELRAKLAAAGFEIVRLNYFNLAGYFAWWLTFCVLKKRDFNPAAVKLYDRAIFPVVHWLEYRVCRPPFGQSLLAVARAR